MAKISVSKLSTMEYCEYKPILQKILKEQKVKAPKPTKQMIEGKIAHQKLHKQNIKQKELEKKIEEATGIKPEIDETREVRVKGEQVFGRIDQIEIGKDSIRIVDDKPSETAYDGYKLQVWAYCLAYEQQENPTVPLKGAIRNYKTDTIIWEEDFTDEKRAYVQSKIDRYNGIIDGTIEPIPSNNSKKCDSCNLRNNCDKRALDTDILDLII